MGTVVLKYGDSNDPTFVTREVEIDLPETWSEMEWKDQAPWLEEKILANTINGKNGVPQVFIFREERT